MHKLLPKDISVQKPKGRAGKDLVGVTTVAPPPTPPVLADETQWGQIIYRPGPPSHANTLLIRPRRFDATTEEGLAAGKEFLGENGFVVYSNVLSPAEIEQAKEHAWGFLEGIGTGIKRTSTKTWDRNSWPQRQTSGVIFQHGVGHSKLLWQCRSNPNVQNIYATIWNTNQLITSFDGCGVFRPWFENPSWRTSSSWLHADQHHKTPRHTCVQGLINLLPTGIDTGGFYCVPTSDRLNWETLKLRPNLYQPYKVPLKDEKDRFCMLKNYASKEMQALVESMPKVVVLPEPGDMVLWDSRTIHANHPGIRAEGLEQNQRELIRIAAYVCMTPRRPTNVDDFVAQRIRASMARHTSCHEPFRLILSNDFGSRNDGSTLKWDQLTESQRLLVTGNYE